MGLDRGRHYYIKNYTDSWIFEWHYSPINEKSVNDFGIDLKAYWNRLLPNTHRMEVGFGLSRFNYSPDPQRLITTQLISITMGYSL